MEIVGYISAIFIGMSLGLIGGGGSILTVPVFLYLFHMDERLATGYSLFVVGTAALIGGIQKQRQGNADLKTAIIFGIPAVAAVFFTRYTIVPAIPDVLFTAGDFDFTRRMLMMGIFAVLMVAASISMIRNGSAKAEEVDATIKRTYNIPLIIVEGIVVGVLTGMVGAGGGFLIIPALVILGKLPMKLAVGTSLLIIAFKSMIGFIGDILNYSIDWQLLMIFTALAAVGILLGNALSNKVEGRHLKKGFGYFVLVMGIYILTKEFFLNGSLAH